MIEPFALIFAKMDVPRIYDRVPVQDPTVVDQPWFFPSTAILALLVVLLVLLLLFRWKRRRRERAKQNPAYILRMRMDSIATRTEKPGNAFFSELASIQRTAIGICFGMSATPKTSREIQASIEGKDNFGRANAALDILRTCEAAMFSGESPQDISKLLADARTACAALVPAAFLKARAEDMLG